MTNTKLTRREGLTGIGTAAAAVAIGSAAASTKAAAAVPAGTFDQSNIIWNSLDGIDHVWYHVLKVDPDAKTVDLLLKFAANQRIVLHRHHADYSTFIIQGELRLYDEEGTLTEIRPTASFVEKPGGGAPHTEGGGDVDCIAWFSNRGTDGVIYEILGPDKETVATLGLPEFKALWEAQATPVQPVIPG
jgi:quercetin dioxygenase-like cupin family protein